MIGIVPRVETIAMTGIDGFRQTLAALLLEAADRRRRSAADGPPSGQDIKAIELLERLAADAPHLEQSVYAACGSALSEEPLAPRFRQRQDELLAGIGIIVCPRSAAALVVWLHGQMLDDTGPTGRGAAPSRPVDRGPAPFSRI